MKNSPKRVGRHLNRSVLSMGAMAALMVLGTGVYSVSPASGSPKVSTPTTIKTLEFVNPLPGVSVWDQISTCMGAEAQAKGITYTTEGPPASEPADETVMIQEEQEAVAQGINALVTFPVSAATGPVLQQAQQAGVITATLYGTGLPSDGADVNAGVDWTTIGQQYVANISKTKGKHVVGLVTEGATGAGGSWIQGMEKAAKKTKNVKIAGVVFIGADASQALPEVKDLIEAHPNINVVASNTGLMTQGGVTAIKELGLKGKVTLVTINNADGGPQAVEDGYATGLFLQNLCLMAKQTVDALVTYASNQVVVPLIPVPDVIATKANIKKYIKMGWN